jgi:peptide-methionine (R)-S-oxide reductase
MKRRILLQGLAVAPLMVALARFGGAAQRGGVTVSVEELQKNWKEYLAEGADVALSTEELKRSEAEWKQSLTPAQFDVLRREGTERPFTSPLNDEKRDGVFVCAGCSLPLLTSAMKFDSGTGWPSFFTTIAGALDRIRYFMIFCQG